MNESQTQGSAGAGKEALSPGLVVHKLGGTSVRGAERLAAAAALLAEAAADRRSRPVAVTSAMGGVTDLLVQAAGAAAEQEGGAAAALVDRILAAHREAFDTLVAAAPEPHGPVPTDAEATWEGCAELIAEVRDLLRGTALVGALSTRVRDRVLATGEKLAARLLALALRLRGHAAEALDADTFLETDGTFGGASPLEGVADRTIRAALRAALDRGVLPVVTGFCGRGPDGATTTLGRGGSDLTATILAKALEAERVVIWTDVEGVFSADPRTVADARVIPHLNYREAAEISFYGAKVLYQRTMIPIVGPGIPLEVRSSFSPQAPGTVIDGRFRPGSHPVKAVPAVRAHGLVTVQGKGMAGVPGVAARVFGALAAKGISVTMISQASSEASITLAVPTAEAPEAESALKQEFRSELSRGEVDEISVRPGIGLVAAVGIGMQQTPGIAQHVCAALGRGGINIHAIAQGSSELNVTLAVDEAELDDAVRALHREFQLGLSQLSRAPGGRIATASLVLVGLGRIGRAVASMVAESRAATRTERGLDLRIVGLADRSGSCFAPEGLAGEALASMLEAKAAGRGVGGQAGAVAGRDASELIALAAAARVDRPILVDGTDRGDAAALFLEALDAGFDVVTANKKPLADVAADPKALEARCHVLGRQLRAEATVGAGLPVLSTLETLVATGDRVRRIEGCLSGTLGILTSSLEAGTALSEAVRQAAEAGCTEPDPMEDLSGADVARKAVILARLAGLAHPDTDLAAVGLEPLADPALAGLSLDELLAALGEHHDAPLARRAEDAAAAGQVLRYVATIEAGEISVGLRSLPRDHPLADLRGSDNRIVFETERYSERPLVITGPGAGVAVTAMGVYGDILRIAAERGR